MEYVDGGDLQKLFEKIKGGWRMKQPDIEKMILQIVEGVKYMHELGVCHRDIKGLNVFMDKKKNIKLGDFGISKQNKHGLMETVVGTPMYLAPEMIRKKKYGYKVDVWAIGVLIYNMVVG